MAKSRLSPGAFLYRTTPDAGVPPAGGRICRFAGHAHRHDVEAAASRLLGELGKAGIAARGTQFLMRYNAPMTPGFLRRNEVGVEVER